MREKEREREDLHFHGLPRKYGRKKICPWKKQKKFYSWSCFFTISLSLYFPSSFSLSLSLLFERTKKRRKLFSRQTGRGGERKTGYKERRERERGRMAALPFPLPKGLLLGNENNILCEFYFKDTP